MYYPSGGSGYSQAVPVAGVVGGPDGGAKLQQMRQQMSTQDILGCEVTLFLRFAGLKSKDLLSKSDPFAEVFIMKKKQWVLLKRTSVVNNLHTGSWPESVELRYVFEEMQQIMVRVWDHDNGSNHDFLGEAHFTLGNLMGAIGQTLKVALTKPNKPNKDRGLIQVTAEKKSDSFAGSNLRIQLRAHKLDAKDWGGLGRSDPYFLFERKIGDNWISVHKSEWIKSNCNPVWKECVVSMDKLCRGNPNEQIRVRIFDWDDGTKDDLIGDVVTTVNNLVEAGRSHVRLDVIHPPTKKKYQKSSYKNSGQLEVMKAVIEKSPTNLLLDYIAGGLNLNLAIAVDWTASNGNPADPRSLHYHNNNTLNQYQDAILSVGNILQAYDSDNMIAALGFGGVFNGSVSHCFPLNSNPHNCEVHGIPGVMQAYDNSLRNYALSGPTYFAPLLNYINGIAHNPEMSQQSQSYTILMILTDGEVMDMQQTVDQLVRGSALPLSVVIVGIGSAEFSKMEYLDGDGLVLSSSNGTRSRRDIVQFVPFSRCRNDGSVLAKETLAEIPGQIVEYFRQNNIRPNPPLQAPPSADFTSTAQVVSVEAVPPPSAPLAKSQNLASSGRQLLAQAYQL